MKPNAFDTVKSEHILLFLLLVGFSAVGQVKSEKELKSEREFRIKKSQFPPAAMEVAEPFLDGVRRLRFYKEIDRGRVSYEIKFKKDRLHYSVEFAPDGGLEDVEVRIRPLDIPDASWKAVQEHLGSSFAKYRVQKIQQQYLRSAFPSDAATFRNAFQNLLLPEIRYELMVRGKGADGYRDYEITYDALGAFLSQRESLPPNYDHVLY